MAERDDITIVQDVTPRYAEIASPSTEIVMQDYVDTLRVAEDDFQNMSFPFLINASGKEDLGGGTLVAITVQEQNLQLAFQQRTAPAETGTVTTASGPPSVLNRIRFTDTSADFVTAAIQPGSYIVNWTDRNVTDVLRVISATELELRTPSQGTDNEYDLGDDYSVWNITQVRTSGGNLVAVDTGGSAIPAILPTWGTQVILTTSSSATIQELTEIRYATYQNAVWVDQAGGSAGQTYPAGTPLQPVNNIPDAVAIANALGFHKLHVHDGLTLDTGDDVEDLILEGDDPELTTVTINTGANVLRSQFRSLTMTGVLDGDSVISDCVIQPPLTFVEGTLRRCLIEAGTITLGGTADVNIINCYSGVAGTATPIIDYNGSGRDLILRNWSGGIEVQNKTGADAVSIDLISGQIILDSTVTAGTIRVAGTGKLTDNSTATVDDTGLVNNANVAAAVWNALVATYSAAGSFGQQVGRKLLTVGRFLGLR